MTHNTADILAKNISKVMEPFLMNSAREWAGFNESCGASSIRAYWLRWSDRNVEVTQSAGKKSDGVWSGPADLFTIFSSLTFRKSLLSYLIPD